MGNGFQLVVHISYIHLFWTDSVWNFPVVVWVWVVAPFLRCPNQVAFPIYFPESSHVVSQLEAPEAPEGGTMAQHSTWGAGRAWCFCFRKVAQVFFPPKKIHAPTWPTWFCDVTVAAARLYLETFVRQVNRGITLASWRWYNPSSHVPLWECFGNCWMWFVTVERLGKSGRNKEHLKRHQCFWIGRKDISEAGKPGNSNTTNQVVGFDSIFCLNSSLQKEGGKVSCFFLLPGRCSAGPWRTSKPYSFAAGTRCDGWSQFHMGQGQVDLP